MTGLTIALVAGACATCWFVLTLREAWSRTQPVALLAVARPGGSPEDVEIRASADLLAGTLDAAAYRVALARLAAADSETPVLH